MTREEAWQRHLGRVERLTRAQDKKAEAIRIKGELVAAGHDAKTAESIVRESWNFAKGQVKKPTKKGKT